MLATQNIVCQMRHILYIINNKKYKNEKSWVKLNKAN